MMGEGILFNSLAGLATLSALALLFLRSPLKLTLAAALNVLSILALFILLEAPLLALIQFVVMSLLFAGTIQLIRGIGPQRFYVRRGLSFAQLMGLILSFLLGALVLLHITSLATDLPAAAAELSFSFYLGPTEWTLLGLMGLVLFAAVLVFRVLMTAANKEERSQS